jgi:ferrous iron transport protein B
LKGTVAGRIGQILEHITSAVGFDYRTNIALIGGFAAKEVVVSTLGTAYSLGEVDPEKSGSLSEKLKEDPQWNPLVAFTLILFTMLYVPCLATVISIKKESSWRWAGFSVGFNLIVAYLVSFVVYQTGLALGLGG